jgi:hypothetical protein
MLHCMSLVLCNGTLRHFMAAQHVDHFRCEADTDLDALTESDSWANALLVTSLRISPTSQETSMQDVILAAAGAAADGTVVPDAESAPAVDAGENAALREAAAGRSARPTGSNKAVPTNALGSSRSSRATRPRAGRNWRITSLLTPSLRPTRCCRRSRNRPPPRTLSTMRWR